MEKLIKENIERLAEICAASLMVKIGDELKNEQKDIITYLDDKGVVDMKGMGFSFNGDDYKDVFLDVYRNF